MVDVTPVFKATVKRVRLQRLSTGTAACTKKKQAPPLSVFSQQANSLLSDITQLFTVLVKCRADYAATDVLLDSMTTYFDEDQNLIERQAVAVIKSCGYMLNNLRQAVKCETALSEQDMEHRKAVLEILDNYLKSVVRYCSKRQAILQNRALQARKMLKLSNLVSTYNRSKENEEEKKTVEFESSTADDRATADEVDAPQKRNPWLPDRISPEIRKRRGYVPVSTPDAESSSVSYSDYAATVADFSSEEMSALRVEQQQLFHHLTKTTDELGLLESSVAEISRLQTAFADNILQQEGVISNINEKAVFSTENVAAANEWIKQAMKKKSGMRIWILFCVIVLSFTLLFLDWYNS